MQTTIDNIQVHYTVKGNGKPMLILPGWGASASAYTLLQNLMAEKYCVYALDMPGFGVTEEPTQPWDVSQYADFTIKFIQSMGLEHLLLAGHSYGGRIIIKICSGNYPVTVDEILLIDSAGIKNSLSPEQQKRQVHFQKLKRFYGSKPVAVMFPNALEKLRQKYGSADYAAASPLMRQTLVKSVSEDLSELIPSIRQKVLLIWGTADTATPVSNAETFHSMLPDSTLRLIEGAGHFPFIDNPFEFRKVITDYYQLSK